ncbi:MAG: ATP-binding domain-containing protein [Oscillospiraceae bacterium]
MLNRNLVYTGITRAKHRVILVGQPGMLCMAIHRNETGNRNTALAEHRKLQKVYDIK